MSTTTERRIEQKIKQIDELLDKARLEAIKEGVDVSSSEFKQILERLKRKLLKSFGITEEEYEGGEEVNTFEAISRVADVVDEDKEDFRKEIKSIISEHREEMKQFSQELEDKVYQKLKDNVKEKIDSEVGKVRKEQEGVKQSVKESMKNMESSVENSVESLRKEKDKDIKKMSSNVESAKKEKGKEFKKLKKKTQKEVEKLRKSMPEQQFSQEEIDKIKKKFLSRAWFEEIQQEINDITPRLWRGMAAGLKKQINKESVENRLIENEVPSGTVDGSNKEFTLPKTPVSGSEKLYMNGQRLSSAKDYSISGKTITFSVAPPTGSNLLADYKKQV